MRRVAQTAAIMEHQIRDRSRLDQISWDDLRLLLVCTEAASFREAGRQMGISSSTVVRSIERLESSLQTLLFNRLPEGIVLTDAGKGIAESARSMETAFIELERKRSITEETAHGRVTIAVTEGLGSFWVMPKLVQFQRQHPNIAIDLYCGMESVDVLRLEADIAIQFAKPATADLIAQRIAKFHLHPFASREYLDIYGIPKNYDDLQHHRFVQQVTPELDSSAFAAYFRLQDPDRSITVRTNTSTAHLYAIEKGAGIGGLPNFALALGAPVVPIDIGPGYSLDIWLTWHAETRRSRHKALVLDWIKSIFNREAYPWFADTPIHPLKLVDNVAGPAATNLGRGFLAVDPAPLRKVKTHEVS